MKPIKILTLILALGIGIGTCVTLLPSADYYLDKAHLEITNKDYVAAELTLAKLEREYPKDWNNLYRSALYATQGHFDKALKETERALQKSHSKTPQELHEIYLNLAAYSYLTGKKNDFIDYLSQAKKICDQSSFCLLLQGLEAFILEDYDQALSLWSKKDLAQDTLFEGNWKNKTLVSTFDSHWLNKYFAYALIEKKNYFDARELLEKENHLLSFQNKFFNQLMGLSYVKEASQIEISKRIPYYKLARFYFGNEPILEEGKELGFKDVNLIFQNEACDLATQLEICPEETLPYLCESLFFFIQHLEMWNKAPLLDQIACILSEQLQILIKKDQYPLGKKIALALQHRFKEGFFKDKLITHLTFQIKKLIQEDDQPLLSVLWDLIDTVSNNDVIVENEVCMLLINKIYQQIEAKDFWLAKIIPYISLWSSIEKDPIARQQFNCGLMHGAELLWRSEGSEKKATSLMEICFSLATENEKITLYQRAKNYLTALYHLAKDANTVKRLALIFDAMDQLHIEHQELIDREKIANHLADAHYLFFAEHYCLAQSNSEWVLKLDPYNQDAIWIMGLSCFYQGDYTKAQEVLTLLNYPDEKAIKALALCQLYKAQHFDKEIAAQMEPNSLQN